MSRLPDILRGERLKAPPDAVARFTSSVDSDRLILKPVVDINRAHVVMLVEQGILTAAEGSALLRALAKIPPDMELDPKLEDVHMNVEARVVREIGEDIGGKLHMAKSRNDQVSAALRMKLRSWLLEVASGLLDLEEVLLDLAERHVGWLMPGYSHLQHAQPTTLASYFLSYFDALLRGIERLKECYGRVNKSPMGACALATTSFPINRDRVGELLGFEGLVESSIDAVSSRDFAIEAMSVLALIMSDLSRVAEELVLWSSAEFGFVRLANEYVSTSSIMPQKRNPVVPEVVRARSTHVFGNLFAALSTVRSLSSGYSLDLQELNARLWECCEITSSCVEMMRRTLETAEFDRDRLSQLVSKDFSTATDLVDALVRKLSIPFRQAYHIVGVAVEKLRAEGKSLEDLTPELLKAVARRFGLEIEIDQADIAAATCPEESVKLKVVKGGPAPKEVERMIAERHAILENHRVWVKDKVDALRRAEEELAKAEAKIHELAEAKV